jgi:hypothetical protein
MVELGHRTGSESNGEGYQSHVSSVMRTGATTDQASRNYVFGPASGPGKNKP